MINQIEPWITDWEISEVTKCITSTFVTEGKYTDLFERKIQQLHSMRTQPVAYCNATAALYAALKILGIQRGQEVIVPSTTFIASANAVLMAGGIPVCVDIDSSFNLDISDLVENINPNTFAVMPVHLYGHFTNVFEVRDVCDDAGLYMLEDASQGVGVCSENGVFAGTVGDIGVLSFYGNKFVTSAQGGMLLSSNEGYLEHAKRFKNHGRASKGTFFHEDIGFNFCTSDLHSALGVAQLDRFEDIRANKALIHKRYSERLASVKEVCIDVVKSVAPAYWFISIFCDNAELLQGHLSSEGVQSRRAFPPLQLQPCYENFNDIKFSREVGSNFIYKSYLSLPSKATLSMAEVDEVCDTIASYYG